TTTRGATARLGGPRRGTAPARRRGGGDDGGRAACSAQRKPGGSSRKRHGLGKRRHLDQPEQVSERHEWRVVYGRHRDGDNVWSDGHGGPHSSGEGRAERVRGHSAGAEGRTLLGGFVSHVS